MLRSQPTEPTYEPHAGTWGSGSHMDRREFARTWLARLAVVRALGAVAWSCLTDDQADDATRAEEREGGGGAAFVAALPARGAA